MNALRERKARAAGNLAVAGAELMIDPDRLIAGDFELFEQLREGRAGVAAIYDVLARATQSSVDAIRELPIRQFIALLKEFANALKAPSGEA